jgi:hypothetical protein
MEKLYAGINHIEQANKTTGYKVWNVFGEKADERWKIREALRTKILCYHKSLFSKTNICLAKKVRE